MPKVVCIVQARMNSKRLPGKVALPLPTRRTVLGEVLTRCQKIPGVDQVICATPDNTCVNMAWVWGFDSYVGFEEDVLARYYYAATVYKADIIVRVTADCPLISPELCGEVLAALTRNNADYSSNVHPRTFPQGFDCEAFTMDALRRAFNEAGESQREHVTTWMLTAPIKRVNVRSPWPMDGRLTLDTLDDYNVICAALRDHEFNQYRKAA